MDFLTTERLRLRRFRDTDLDLLVELDTNPDVMRFVGEGKTRSREEIGQSLRRIIERYEEYPGLGLWPAFRRSDERFIGWFALKPLARRADIEVGYRLLPRAWGQGYATEGAKALLAYGFGKLGLAEVVAIVDPSNGASRRVLEKCGLRFVNRDADPYDDDAAKEVEFYVLQGEPSRG